MFIAALGRCMAAYSDLNKPELKREFEMLRWADPPSFEEYWQEVQQVRVLGYACDEGRYVKGVTTISVPVLGRSKQVVMAISAVGFSAQLTLEKISILANDLTAHAQIISRGLTL
jgi:DNA-binding IclR family transcriptional regulator